MGSRKIGRNVKKKDYSPYHERGKKKKRRSQPYDRNRQKLPIIIETGIEEGVHGETN